MIKFCSHRRHNAPVPFIFKLFVNRYRFVSQFADLDAYIYMKRNLRGLNLERKVFAIALKRDKFKRREGFRCHICLGKNTWQNYVIDAALKKLSENMWT